MDLKVNRAPIDEWVDRNGPDGLVKLAQKAEISSSTMNKVRAGLVPKKRSTRIKICRALQKKEADVFIPVGAGVEVAS